MAHTDLEHFVIDCRIKTQQIQFLQSLRPTADEKLRVGAANAMQPWQVLTNPDQYYNRRSIHGGRTEWLINQLTLQLAYNC